MTSFAHDADVIVYNYKNRVPESELSVMDTDMISLRDAIVNIQCNKTKESPQGSFSITLKPTTDWSSIIIPGSWCAIFMSDRPLTSDDYDTVCSKYSFTYGDNNTATNYTCPLKMIGMVMGVRIHKQVSSEGIITITYTMTGYDFGYVFTSQIYINYLLQDDVANGQLQATFNKLSFPTDDGVFADPVVNVNRVLNAWSVVSQGDVSISNPSASSINPPPIRMQIPSSVTDLFHNNGSEVLQFIYQCIGLDGRSDKVVDFDMEGNANDFSAPLIGEKAFHIWKLILHNSLWGMINEYLNPLMNEAYCDLHVTDVTSSLTNFSNTLQPVMIARQIPFNTPNYEQIWNESLTTASTIKQKFPVTMIHELPKTYIPSSKVLSYDVGFSDYERTNFAEINGYVINGPKAGIYNGPFNAANLPAYDKLSINRVGLRPRISMGNDYGISQSRLNTAGLWRPLLVDWWFNANKFASGTVECIGLSEHIAIGENIQLVDEKVIAHIESYTHTFSVDGAGNKIFRTSIEFTKGIHSDSSSDFYYYVYGGSDFAGVDEPGIVTGDVNRRASFTKIGSKGLDINKKGGF